MHLIRAEAAPRFDLPGVTFTALAAPSRGSAELCAWQITVEPGLESPEAHTIDRDEVFLVVAGEIRLAPSGEVAHAGDVVVVPAGEPIQLANPGDVPAQVHVAVTAGFNAQLADGTAIGTPPWAQ